MKRNVLLLPFLLLLVTACRRDHGEAEDKEPPEVKITSPANGQTFGTGQSIILTADAADASQLEELHLEIINTTTGTFITHEHYVPNGTAYKLQSNFTPTAAAAYKIKVEADDAKGNNGEAEISITVR